MLNDTSTRKLEHIEICAHKDVEAEKTTLLEEIYPIHMALPEINYEDIDTSTWFLGKKISAPLMVTGMTGGHAEAAIINKRIAEAVEETKLAMGVGSQRAAIENEKLAYTYSIARKHAPTSPIVANIGAPQILKGYGVKELRKAIEMIEADAIAIHLNPGQELFQPEGDRNFKNLIESIRKIIDHIPVPIIIKETGSGLSREVIDRLSSIGIKYYDVSGMGGTNWIKVEILRAREKGISMLSKKCEEYFSSWGIPTAASVFETRWAAPESFIISSGGIRSGVDIAKSILIGADMSGVALPILRAALKGTNHVIRLLEIYVKELKFFMFLTGSQNIRELASKDFIVGINLYNWLIQRNIDLARYKKIRTMYLDERIRYNKPR